MKRILYFIFASIFFSVTTACDSNNTIDDLSNPGVFTPNVYFLPIDPIAPAGSTINTEVEYWSDDDDFVAIELLQSVFLDDKISFNLSAVNYAYTYENRRDKVEEELVGTIPHNFNAFVPAKNAYVITPEYVVPSDFRRVTRTSSNSSIAELQSSLPPEAIEDFYDNLVSNLSKTQLQTILVEVDSVITLATFESYFEESSFTGDGRNQVIGNLQLIGLQGLIKPDFRYELSHRVALFFTIENGLGGVNSSVARAFTVN